MELNKRQTGKNPFKGLDTRIKKDHLPGSTLKWFRSKHLNMLEVPSQILYFNSIENLWQDLKPAHPQRLSIVLTEVKLQYSVKEN